MRYQTQAVLSPREEAQRRATKGVKSRAVVREYHRDKRLNATQRRAQAHRVTLIGRSNIRDFLAKLVAGEFAEGPGK